MPFVEPREHGAAPIDYSPLAQAKYKDIPLITVGSVGQFCGDDFITRATSPIATEKDAPRECLFEVLDQAFRAIYYPQASGSSSSIGTEQTHSYAARPIGTPESHIIAELRARNEMLEIALQHMTSQRDHLRQMLYKQNES